MENSYSKPRYPHVEPSVARPYVQIPQVLNLPTLAHIVAHKNKPTAEQDGSANQWVLSSNGAGSNAKLHQEKKQLCATAPT